MTDLFPYQREGAAFLASKPRALLADTMGLGKTAQAIDACRRVQAHEVFIVCPASLVKNWYREFKRFWPNPQRPVSVEVISYDKLARNFDPLEHMHDVVILDEAHYLKNKDAKRTQAVFGPKCDGLGGVIDGARHVWALTGTPAPNNAAEMWPMLRAMAPETIHTSVGKPRAYSGFLEQYCVTKLVQFGQGQPQVKILRSKNLDDLKTRIGSFVLRRKVEDVLKDLPPIRFGEITLSDKLATRELAKVDGMDECARLMAHIEAGHDIDALSAHLAEVRRAIGTLKAPAVAAHAADFLDQTDEKIVVFAWHKDVVSILAQQLASYGPAVVTGVTPATMRQAQVDTFQTDPACRVFIGQIRAAGAGLTLTAANTLLFAELSWTPADNVQAAKRIHRIGQTKPCLVEFVTLDGSSVDAAVTRCLARKVSELKELFE